MGLFIMGQGGTQEAELSEYRDARQFMYKQGALVQFLLTRLAPQTHTHTHTPKINGGHSLY